MISVEDAGPDSSALTLILPAYNESKTIRRVLERVRHVLPATRIIVVDDGSSDSTSQEVIEFEDANVSIVRLDTNTGKGAAMKAGATLVESEFFGYLDADLDIHPNGVVRALGGLQNDPGLMGMLGSKMHRESLVSYPWWRRLWSGAFRRLIRLVFNVSISDTQTGLKVFRTSAVLPLVPQIRATGWLFDLELVLRIKDLGGKVSEVPVELDFDFTSSISVSEGLSALLEVRRLWLQRNCRDSN